MIEDELVVIPLPLDAGGITYTVAKLVVVDDVPFAEIITAAPGTRIEASKKIMLSRYGLNRIRPSSPGRPELYFYEGMIMPASAGGESQT
jgi:hypothetical protein